MTSYIKLLVCGKEMRMGESDVGKGESGSAL